MEQLHAHEVLHMMEGNSYTEASLRAAIVEKFGEHQRFILVRQIIWKWTN